MADEQNPNPDTNAQSAAPAPQPGNGSPQITPEIQALIDAAKTEAAQQAKNAAWAEARRTFEAKSKPTGGQQPPSTPPKQDPPPNGNGQDALAILALRDAFDDATSELSLTGSQKKFVRELVMKERPADVGEYVSNFVTMSGWNAKPNPAGTPATTAAPTTTAAAAPTVPVTSRATPPTPSAPTDDTPILSMSDADKKALNAKLGDIKFAERLLKEVARDNVRVRPRLV